MQRSGTQRWRAATSAPRRVAADPDVAPLADAPHGARDRSSTCEHHLRHMRMPSIVSVPLGDGRLDEAGAPLRGEGEAASMRPPTIPIC